MPSRRTIAWQVLAVLAMVAIVATLLSKFLVREDRLEPEPLNIAGFEILGDRQLLRPHVQHLLSEIEAGKMLGSPAEQYQTVLDRADRKGHSDNGKMTVYAFYARPEDAPLNKGPALIIMVQRKFGHVVRCVAVVPFEPD